MLNPATATEVVSMTDMAQTVVISDPDTGREFRATRRQYELLHKPRGRIMIADEDGQPIKKARKPKTADQSAQTEE